MRSRRSTIVRRCAGNKRNHSRLGRVRPRHSCRLFPCPRRRIGAGDDAALDLPGQAVIGRGGDGHAGMRLAVFGIVARGLIVDPADQDLALHLDVLNPLAAGIATPPWSWLEHGRCLAAHAVRLVAVDGEGGCTGGEAAKLAVGKPDFREPIVGDIAGWTARNERNADPHPHRGGEIKLLLLPGRGNGLHAGLGQRVAAIDAVSVGLARPWIGVPGEVVDTDQAMLGGRCGKIGAQLFDEESAGGFLRRARRVGVGKSPFGDPAGLPAPWGRHCARSTLLRRSLRCTAAEGLPGCPGEG